MVTAPTQLGKFQAMRDMIINPPLPQLPKLSTKFEDDWKARHPELTRAFEQFDRELELYEQKKSTRDR